MISLLAEKPLEDYPNNIQRDMTVDEYFRALSLYREITLDDKIDFVLRNNLPNALDWLNDYFKHLSICYEVNYDKVSNLLDVYYGNPKEIGICITFIKDVDKIILSDTIVIEISGLDYSYTVNLTGKVEIK